MRASPRCIALLLTLAACKGGGSAIDAGFLLDDGGNPIYDADPTAIDGAPPDADTSCTAVSGTAVRLEQVSGAFEMPVYVTSPPGDPRLFVLEKEGTIKILDNGVVVDPPFLTVPTDTSLSGGSEIGLLGLAFHPDYATNRKLYVFYTDTSGDDTVVAQYLADAANPDRADPASAQVMLTINDPTEPAYTNYNNHNGGTLQFGNDGFLYVSVGDGGAGDDPSDYGQNINSKLGKILRLDVSSLPATAAAGNPFIDVDGDDMIWSYGWRNPWRFSFDRETGDMYIGDVGQNAVEEVDVEPASSPGRNYGWDEMEGNICHEDCEPIADDIAPIYTYNHNTGSPTGCTVIGGYVYRGCRMPDLRGTYFFADYCPSWVRSLRWNGNTGYTELTNHTALAGSGTSSIVSFGEDYQGELYIVRQNTGQIMKIVPQ